MLSRVANPNIQEAGTNKYLTFLLNMRLKTCLDDQNGLTDEFSFDRLTVAALNMKKKKKRRQCTDLCCTGVGRQGSGRPPGCLQTQTQLQTGDGNRCSGEHRAAPPASCQPVLCLLCLSGCRCVGPVCAQDKQVSEKCVWSPVFTGWKQAQTLLLGI